jgi:hypothetical protein
VDREDHVLEAEPARLLQQGMEGGGDDGRIVSEHAAAPGAEHQPPVSVRGGNLKYPPGPRAQHARHGVRGLRLAGPDRGQVGCGGGEEGARIRARQQRAVLVAEYRDTGRVDDPVAVAQIVQAAVEVIELRRGLLARVERGGAGDALLLCVRAGQNPPPGLLAEAKTRHAVSAGSRRAAASVVSAVTSSRGRPPGEGEDGRGAPGG